MSGTLARLAGRASAATRSRWVRVGFAVIVVGLAVWAVASRWDEVSEAAQRLDPRLLAAAALATVGNLLCTGLGWRAVLADLGSRLPLGAAARVFFVGQLGKYLPGSVWPVLVQAELARDRGVPRRRSTAAMLAFMLLGVVSGLLVVLLAVPVAPAVAGTRFSWVLVLAVPLLAALHPRVLGRGFGLALRLAGRPPLEQWTTLRGTGIALAWTLAAWGCAGLQVWCLVVGIGGPRDWRSLVLCTGGYALAWSAGLIVVLAPAGAGARELALAAILSGVLDTGAVLVVVLASRVLFTVADLTLSGLALTGGRVRPVPVPRPERPLGDAVGERQPETR